MKLNQVRYSAIALLCLSLFTRLYASDVKDNVSLEVRITEIVTQIKTGSTNSPGDLSKLASELGGEVIPLLLQHTGDEDPLVRLYITLALCTTKDERATLPLIERLNDSDANVRREALWALYKYWPREWLQKQAGTALPALAKYAKGLSRGNDQAVLLMGDIGDALTIPTLKALQQETLKYEMSEPIQTKEDPNWRWIPKKKESLTKALTKLGDKDATEKVLNSLKKEDTTSRAFGIEAVAYADRKELLENLLPLLDDKRDALNIAPCDSEEPYYMRVCDLAANAVLDVLKLRTPIEVATGRRHTDEKIDEVKAILQCSD